MASVLYSLPVTIFFAFLLIANPTFAADSPSSSPSPSPQLPPGSNSPPSPPPATPSPSPALDNSPPAPPTPDLNPDTPSPSPSPSPSSDKKKSPSPAPALSGGISREDQPNAGDFDTKEDSSGGMSGGKKAGVAFGVIGAACLAGLGVLVYKKRQLNIRRSQYGNAARSEFL